MKTATYHIAIRCELKTAINESKIFQKTDQAVNSLKLTPYTRSQRRLYKMLKATQSPYSARNTCKAF